MSFLIAVSFCLYLINIASGSTLTTPPQSALVVGFENIYDLSLLANSLSDQGIYPTLIVPAQTDIYDHLIDVEVIRLNVTIEKSAHSEARALKFCEELITNNNILKNIRESQPTFTIFPALRHDGCLLPWVKHIESIPVIWTGNSEQESYALEATGFALPINNGGFWTRLSASFTWKSIFSSANDDYVTPALRLTKNYLPTVNVDRKNLFDDVRLVLWGADTVLRAPFASLTQSLVEIGCHHCRGVLPLPSDLQKSIVEYRLGAVIVLLDANYKSLVENLAQKLPQGRQGQAVVWKVKGIANAGNEQPENLFISETVDRQDIIGCTRARVVLSHCSDTEFLETGFHGTPVICFPRSVNEIENARRAMELGFGDTTEAISDPTSADQIADIVRTIHEKVDYRENARKVSLAIRDRLNPAIDRLIYWLGYVARTKDSGIRILVPRSNARTFAEDSQFILGFFVGGIIGAVISSACIFMGYMKFKSSSQRSKGRYAR